MGADNILPSDGIEVTLGGEKKLLKFNLKSLATLSKKHGTIIDVLNMFSVMAGGNVSAGELECIADLMSAAMIKNDKTMTPEYIMDNYDFEEVSEIVPEVIEAFLSAMGKTNKKKADNDDPQTA